MVTTGTTGGEEIILTDLRKQASVMTFSMDMTFQANHPPMQRAILIIESND